MNNDDKLLQCAERIERLVSRLVENRNGCPKCRVEVSLTADPPEEIYNHPQAAHFLERSEKQVYRYRINGRLPFTRDETGQYCYLKADLERLFEELHGFPKGGFHK